jgi:hypothetical protein
MPSRAPSLHRHRARPTKRLSMTLPDATAADGLIVTRLVRLARHVPVRVVSRCHSRNVQAHLHRRRRRLKEFFRQARILLKGRTPRRRNRAPCPHAHWGTIARIPPGRYLTIAGLSGFLTLIQSREGPDRYGAESRFDTIPSGPVMQACRNINSPLASVCSLSAIPAFTRDSSRARRGLRLLSGNGKCRRRLQCRGRERQPRHVRGGNPRPLRAGVTASGSDSPSRRCRGAWWRSNLGCGARSAAAAPRGR